MDSLEIIYLKCVGFRNSLVIKFLSIYNRGVVNYVSTNLAFKYGLFSWNLRLNMASVCNIAVNDCFDTYDELQNKIHEFGRSMWTVFIHGDSKKV